MTVIDMSDHFTEAQAESAEEDAAFLQRYRRTRAIDEAICRLIERLERKGYSPDEIVDSFRGFANPMVEIQNDPDIIYK